MAAYYSQADLRILNRGREEARDQFESLRERYISRQFRNDRAYEHASHGFGRRLGTLVDAIDMVYEALPPNQVEIPERSKLMIATIAIQSFVLNIFGCLDNLAWIWVYEKDLKREEGADLDPRSVGLGRGCKRVRGSFSNEFRNYLDSRQPWFDHIKEFRDALSHRIPLYIPPYNVSPENLDEYARLEQALGEARQRGNFEDSERLRAEQKMLAFFRPWMTHSYGDGAPVVIFHQQLLIDYVTVDEFGHFMLEELDR